MIVYRTTDLIRVNMKPHTVVISPLSSEQYAKVTANVRMEGGELIQDRAGMIATALKFAIKGFESESEVTFHDGTNFELEWDGDGVLSQQSLDTLFQVLGTGSMSVLGSNITAGTISDLPIVKAARQAKSPPSKKKRA